MLSFQKPQWVFTRHRGDIRAGARSRVFYQHEVYLQITTNEMTQSLCERDTKSKSHPGMKLAPVRVFSCKHPLRACL